MQVNSLERRKLARDRLLRMHYESRAGHIGGNLSVLDLLLTLYHDILGPNDQFVLSKGHAAGALYVTLWTLGHLTDEQLATFHQEDTLLSGHPPASGIPGVLFATGSLGHGFGLAAGLALAKRLTGDRGRVFCITSDGEWNEGSCWESLIFAVHQQLTNLTVIVDSNKLQGFGATADVANLDPLCQKFLAFGAEVRVIDGHNATAIKCGMQRPSDGKLLILVANTVKGRGVSFMENEMSWHYLPMTEAQYLRAIEEGAQS